MDDSTAVEPCVGYVYGLFDQTASAFLWDCRYIGKTRQTMPHRFKEHRSEAKNKPNSQSHCHRWIRKTWRDGGDIVYHIFETHEAPDKATLNEILNHREQVWIASGRLQGWRLTNSTSGGEGGCVFSPEVVERVAQQNRGRKQSPELIEKRAAAVRGQKRSAETRARMSAAQMGKTHSDETKQKLSEINLARGPMSDETRLKMRESQKNRWDDAMRAEVSGENSHWGSQTHCIRGHEFTPENTYINPNNGWRFCRECRRLRKLGLL